MSFDDTTINQFSSPALGTLGLGGKRYAHHSSLQYPNPYLDTSSFYLPKTQKEQLHYCKYYYKTSPVVNPVIRTLARYPITDILVDEQDPGKKEYWEYFIGQKLKLRSIDIEIGLDYYCYGTAIAIIYFPIMKVLVCTNCRREERIEEAQYRFRSLNYELNCKMCGVTNRIAEVKDYQKKSENEIRIIRLNPELVDIETNPLTGQTDYFYTLPRYLRNEIIIGKRHIIETTPDIYIESLRKQRRIRLSDGKVFVFKRPSISEQDTIGWGESIITPVMKTLYYTQILRKAQEAIMHSSIVPLRFVFPQAGDSQSNASPYNAVNLLRWTNTIKTELVKWRRDPNHVGIVPLPVGHQVVGADGKALTLFNELELCFNEVCNGCSVPLELYKGGLSWSGSNMSLKLMQQDFLNYRIELQNFNQEFVLGNIADFLGKNRPKISFSKFKMADDLQRSALENQLFQQQILSAETLLEGMEHDHVKEKSRIKKEMQDTIITQRKTQLAAATVQGMAQNIQMKLQAQGQKQVMALQAAPQAKAQQPAADAMQGGVEDQPPGVTPDDIARQYSNEVEKLPPMERQSMMNQLKLTAPEVYAEVLQLQQGEQGSSFDPLSSMKSEVKPPRSPNATI